MGLKYGASYFETGQFDSASYAYLTLLPYIFPPNRNNYTFLGYIYIGLDSIAGTVYSPEKALSYFQQAAAVAGLYSHMPSVH